MIADHYFTSEGYLLHNPSFLLYNQFDKLEFVERSRYYFCLLLPQFCSVWLLFGTKETLNVYQAFRFLLCKNCGTLCILPLKSTKTDQNRDKNSKITRRSTIFKVFRRYFYAFPLRYASLSCLSIRVTFLVSLP